MLIHGILAIFSNKTIKKVSGKVGGVLYWNWIFRFLVEVYLEIMLTLLVNLVRANWDKDFPAIIFSNIFSYMFLLICGAFPSFILVFYLIRITDWESDRFRQRWGSIIKGVRFDYSTRAQGKKWIAILYPIS